MADEGANMNKHVRFEAGDGNGNPRGVRLSLAGSVSVAISLITLGGFVVGIVRALDPQVTNARIERMSLAFDATDKALAAKIEANAALQQQAQADILRRLDQIEALLREGKR